MRALAACIVLSVACSAEGGAHAAQAPKAPAAMLWPSSIPQGQTRTVDFTTTEGTWMSVDAAPDGQWFAFDMLGHIYRTSVKGGKARNLTPDTGVALNFHPAISPDGKRIAFISDRTGQLGLWIMNSDGSGQRLIFVDKGTRIFDPVWSPDGKSIVAVRGFRTPSRGWHRQNTRLWSFPVDGGEPKELVGGTITQYNAPAFSPDGNFLYFHASFFSGNRFGSQAGYRIQRLNMTTNVIEEMPYAPADLPKAEAFHVKNSSDQPPRTDARIAPHPSPDGRYIAFAKEMPRDSAETAKRPIEQRTSLWLLDLETGKERLLMDPITKDLSSTHAMYAYRILPGYSWTRDSKSILISEGGKFHRIDVKTGSIAAIPFEAHVHRVVSEQVRGHIKIDDGAFAVKFPQWPATSPDGKETLFTAAGKIWIADRRGTTRPLIENAQLGLMLKAGWSSDGKRIAFTAWDDLERGHLWTVKPDGTDLRRITATPNEYFSPSWSPDGKSIVVVRRSPQRKASAKATSNPWSDIGGWEIATYPATGGEGTSVTPLEIVGEAYYLSSGRIAYARQDDVSAAAGLYDPYPGDTAMRQVNHVLSVAPDGTDIRQHAILPPFREVSNSPVLSPNGDWIAFQTSQSIFVRRIGQAGMTSPAAYIETDPNLKTDTNIPIPALGGAYPHWVSDGVVEITSGNKHYQYNVTSGTTIETTIDLKLKRAGGQGRIALRNARILTMDNDRIIPKGTILIEDSRIACVGDCAIRDGDHVIDLTGKTVIPGLVDVHAHQTNDRSGIINRYRSSFLMDLSYGVTTIIDPATWSLSAFPMAELVEAGEIMGPRVYSSAELVGPNAYGLGEQLEIETDEDAQNHVARRAGWGAVTIKNFRLSRREQHQKLIAAARKANVSVTGEGGPLYFTLAMIMDGQTGWEHYLSVLPIYSDVSRFIGSVGATYSPTAIVSGHGMGASEYFRPRYNFADDKRYLRFTPGAPLAHQDNKPSAAPASEFSFPIIARGLRDIVRAGGHGAIGEHGEQNGIGSHWEIWAYATALSPMEALKVATLDGARFIGAEDEIGSVKSGKIADLVVLNSNPLDNIRNSADILYVMKAGELYDARSLDKIWPVNKPLGALPWDHQKDHQGNHQEEAQADTH